MNGLEQLVWCYVCVAMRLGPILATLPPFSFRGVSWLVRALLLTMVSLSVTPLVSMEVSIQVPETHRNAHVTPYELLKPIHGKPIHGEPLPETTAGMSKIKSRE